MVKVQQAADYPDERVQPARLHEGPLVPSTSIHGPDRILTPLIRTGERGSGEFREATWDEVLDRIAGELERIGETLGLGLDPRLRPGARLRATSRRAPTTAPARALGMTHGTSFDFNGDLPMGMPITFGVQNAEHEAKDWANSRFLLLVGANPLETRIPDVHFIFDAVEQGARLVVVDPTFSPTAAKADAWLQIQPGTDAALGLALCRQVIEDGMADWDFMRTYTDAPLLVRADTGKRLRADELARAGPDPARPRASASASTAEGAARRHGAGGPGSVPHGAAAADRYVAWDAAGEPVVVGTERLGIPAGVDAALDGVFTVTLADGSTVEATPGLRARARGARPLDARARRRGHRRPGRDGSSSVARALRAPSARPPSSWAAARNHWFHGDLTGRAFALLAALTGNIGRSGGGFSVYVGQYKVRVDTSPWWSPGDDEGQGRPQHLLRPRAHRDDAPGRARTRRTAGTASSARSPTCSSRRWT